PHVLITNPGTLMSAAGDRVGLSISAVDPDADVPSFSATGLPSGISISSTTGLISGTLSSSADTGSPYTITVSVSDGHGNTDSQTFTWLVSNVLLGNPGNQTSVMGDSISLSLSARDND